MLDRLSAGRFSRQSEGGSARRFRRGTVVVGASLCHALLAATSTRAAEVAPAVPPAAVAATPEPATAAATAEPSPTAVTTPEPASALGPRLRQDLRAMGAAARTGRTWAHIGEGLLVVGAVSTADESLRTRIQESSTPSRVQLAENLRPLGQAGGLAIMGGAWGLGAALHQERLELVGQDGLEATAIASLFTGGLKVATGRVRPRDGEGSHAFHPFSGNQSFPSGEATEAFAIAAVVSHHSEHVWVRSVAWGLASAVGVGRMELDAHWASDVVGGALIGGGVGHWLAARHDPLLAGDAKEARRVPELRPIASMRGKGAGLALEWTW